MRNVKKAFASVATLALVLGLLVVPAFALSDVDGHWAEDSINEAIEAGWVDGFPDGTFAPREDVTRAQFVKMLTAAFELEADVEISFTDVAEDAWFAPYVKAAVANGMIEDAEVEFNGNEALTREEAAIMVYNLLGLEPVETATVEFTDAEDIAEATKVNAVVDAGVFIGDAVGTFRPADTINRAESVIVVDRALQVDVVVGDAVATVTVESGALASFKRVTVTTEVVGAVNFTIAGQTAALGETVTIMVSEDTSDLAIEATDGTVLATATLDVSEDMTEAEVALEVVEEVVVEDPTATLTVESGALASFKRVTVTETNVPGAVNFAVAGNEAAVGEALTVLAMDTTAELTLLNAAGTVVGTYTINFDEEYSETLVNLE